MYNGINLNPNINPANSINTNPSTSPAQNQRAESEQKDFTKIFQQQMVQSQTGVQFSKHAAGRLTVREISLSSDQLKRVEGAITQASEKGIKDSLVLVDNIALVVNVRNKIVVTAMNKEAQNIFTNIDGAVIV